MRAASDSDDDADHIAGGGIVSSLTPLEGRPLMVALLLLALAAAPATPAGPRPKSVPRPAATHAGADADLPPLSCTGTEPFWSLTLESSHLRFTDGERKVELAPGRALKPANRTEPWIWRMRAGKQRAQAIVSQRSCSDGMSEKQYDYEVLFIIGDDAFEGCCEPLEPSDGG